MALKFGRRYDLRVGTESGNTLVIQPPFTIQFDIIRNTLTSANVCQFRIYNLSEKNRNQLRFNSSNYGELRPIEFRAGYGTNLPRVFTGNISQAWSVREGNNFITQIESYDGGFAFNNGTTNQEFPGDTTQRTVVENLIAELPNVELGVIGSGYDQVLGRGSSYSGNTASLLAELSGGGFFIDDGKANILSDNEYIEAPKTLIISPASGLLNTPVLEQTIVRFDMLFEPQLNAGYKVELDSVSGLNFNGEYKIVGVKHRGMISESVCGSVVTTGEFFYTKLLEGVS